MTKPSDAAEGTAVIAVSEVGEMPCVIDRRRAVPRRVQCTVLPTKTPSAKH